MDPEIVQTVATSLKVAGVIIVVLYVICRKSGAVTILHSSRGDEELRDKDGL